jgi:hypothetical protein
MVVKTRAKGFESTTPSEAGKRALPSSATMDKEMGVAPRELRRCFFLLIFNMSLNFTKIAP